MTSDREALEEINDLYDAPLARDKTPSSARVRAGRRHLRQINEHRQSAAHKAFSVARRSTTRRHPKVSLAERA